LRKAKEADMGCESILDKVYEQEDLSFWGQVYVSMHLFTCPDCARKARLFELSRRIIRDEFLPPSPGLESTVMAAIAEEEGEALDAGTEAREIAVSGGFSLRGWVVVGIALLFSLTTIFLGMGFNDVALAAGM